MKTWLYVSEFPAIKGDGVTDDTAAIQALYDSANGRRVVFNRKATYKTGRLKPPNGSHIVMNPNVKFIKIVDSAGLLYLNNSVNVTIDANRAQMDGTDPNGTTVFGHTIYALGTTGLQLNNLFASHSSPNKDVLYLGLGSKPNDGVTIRGGCYNYGKRSCISPVACRGMRILERTEIAYATGSPGAGIDFEANFYDHVSDNIVNAHIHHNQNAGALSIFGVGTVLDNCDVHDNGTYGFGVASGSFQFEEDRFRPDVDYVAVTGFDVETGRIFVSAQPPIGTPVNFSLRNGATLPSGLTNEYWIVSKHVGVDAIILGKSVDHGEVVSFGSAGSGTLSSDSRTSDIRVRVFGPGQSDGNKVNGGKYYNNGAQGLFFTGSGYVLVDGPEVYDNGGNQIQLQYTRDAELIRLNVHGGTSMGLAASVGGGVFSLKDSIFSDTGGRAYSITEWTDAEIDSVTVDNCGATEASSAKAGGHLVSILRPRVTRNRVSQDAGNTTTLFGIYAEGSVIEGVFTDNDLTGAGTTNANSLVVPAGSTKARNKRRDGALTP